MVASARDLILSLAAVCLPTLANIPRTTLLIEKPHRGFADSTTFSSNYYYHSELGYPLCNRQWTNGTPYDLTYTTSPQGAIRSLRYPSGRLVNTAFDDAGRITSVASGAKNYASSIQYASHGPIKGLTLGNGLVESRTYNSRLQPSQIQAGTLLTLGLYYCPGQASSCAGNNGNMATQTVPRPAGTWTQNYTYDSVNRLSTAAETGSGTWNQSYGYDAQGNRWVCAHGGTGMAALTLETPQGSCATTAWFTSQNRITSWGYDGTGNVTSVGGMVRAFTYDGENRQLTATINGVGSSYSYDGEGRRVRAVTPAGTTIFAYDAQGKLAAEYGPGGELSTQYLTADHLGSTRLITTGTTASAVYKDSDYLPFGEELKSGMGGAARGASFDGLGNRVKFTSKERDAETASSMGPGLDYFGARYYGAGMGRWTSADKPFADQFPEDPQSWNLYSYVRNNPLKNVDPSGEACLDYRGAASCGSYVLGGLKAVGNIPSDIINAPNRLMNFAISPVTDFRFPDAIPQTFTASNVDQQQGMEAAGVVMLATPLAEAGAAKVAAIAGPGAKIEAGIASTVSKLGEAGGPGAGKAFPNAVKNTARGESSNSCVFCGQPTQRTGGPTQSNIDHAIPKSRGGNNTLNNAQNTCRNCNLDKRTRTTLEYEEELRRRQQN